MKMLTWLSRVPLLFGLLLVACGTEDAADATPDPLDLLAEAADRMEEVEAFAFLLEHEGGTTTIVGGLGMEQAEGHVAARDRLQAAVRGRVGPLAVNVQLIILPEGAWMTNPLTAQWEPQDLSIAQFFDPATGVTAVMRGIAEAQLAGNESIDGSNTHIVEGMVDSGALALLVPGVVPGRELRIRTWIDEADAVVRRIEIVGPLEDGDSPDLLRRLTLSNFGGDFTVTAPQ
ncbi:MAG: LppX_LprAFG lipoprotein [Gemmatimonadota bacterium]